ncbi:MULTISPECIES: GNAT family protein [unclassified Nocardioides]|uniref:GNAT family N-acetyltransferase n=1 Tax=unclassified Nocardioides TaxID=2615069 RepID=UPI0000571504|nr:MULTISPECIES: GNAT family protein [unclassified Nocardioides]ABL81685.1 GCN5-related N-acetyltransferase [Nocardioides sp. JS614]
MTFAESVAWPHRTARASIRPATRSDAEVIWAIRRRPGVSDFLTGLPGELGPWTDRFVEAERLASTLVVEVGDQVIGDLLLVRENAYSQAEVREQAQGVAAEIGWVVSPDWQGRGLATESVSALLDICFGHLGLHRVVAGCTVENRASWRLMERLGMRREAHTVQSGLHRDGTWHDGYMYAMLRAEWVKVTHIHDRLRPSP